MKFSTALAALILIAAAGLSWQNNQQLNSLRTQHTAVIASAAKLGVSLDPTNSTAVRLTKRGRENREVDAKAVATDFIAFAKEMEAMQEKGGPPDEAMQKRIFDMMERMMALDTAGLKILIAEVRATTDLKDEMRLGLIGFAIMTLANDHPQAALALFTESSDLFKENGMGKHLVSSSLAKWAKDDPQAALEWVRKNSTKFPDLISDDAKNGLISGAAFQDPGLAFELIGELGVKKQDSAVSMIVKTAKTAEERSAVLAVLRDYLAKLPDENARKEISDSALSNLARNAASDGFEFSSKWAAAANLTPTEFEAFSGGLNGSTKADDTGKWIEWIGEKLPNKKGGADIRNLVRNWTQNDYQAAGKWLSSTPEGPTKNTAIRSYAETVSQYEPETAAQWAMTLPPGKDRNQTLRNIYNKWPKEDEASKAAAAAFAKEHGITKPGG